MVFPTDAERDDHERFRGTRADGTRYSALEPEAHTWVRATLLATYVHAHARFGAPMTPADTCRFYSECRGLGRLIGVRERDLPDAPPAPISERLWPVIKLPARRIVRLGGIGLLEPAVRRRLGLGWSPLDEAQFRALGIVSRGLGGAMPASLKVTGPGHLRWRSPEIEAGPLGRAA